MSVSPNDLKSGSVFRDSKGRALEVINTQHVKLSKGGACYQVKCRDIETGSNIETRLNVGEVFEEVYMSKMILTYSYTDGQTAFFMNSDCEMVEYQISELMSVAGLFDNDGNADFKESPKIELKYYLDAKGNSKTIDVKLAEDITLKIVDTRPSIKGEAAKSGHKPAVAEGGVKLKVPPHVNIGDYVTLSKVDLAYIGKK